MTEGAREPVCGRMFVSGFQVYKCALPKGHAGDCDDHPTRGNLTPEGASESMDAREPHCHPTDLIGISRAAFDSLCERIEAAEKQRDELRARLENMVGWVNYAIECDPFYFSEEQAPRFKSDMEKTESLLCSTAPESQEGKV